MSDDRHGSRTEHDLIAAAARESIEIEGLRAAEDGEAGPEAAPDVPDVPGFTILGELHRGGQGIAYEAADDRNGEAVVVKVLLDRVDDDPRERRRLDREGRILAELRHPGIVALRGHGQTSRGQTWIATEFVHGLPLDEHVRLFDRTWPEVLGIAARIAGALSAAHDAGVIHRDLKPANILVEPDGAPHVLDFGLARHAEATEATLTQLGDVFGTPSYMSPEQVSRGGHDVDFRTDIWSLGVTLYQALAGRRPFEGATREALFEAIRFEEPKALARSIPGLPAAVDAVLSTALEKDPDRRYASMEEFRQDLLRAANYEPVRARRTPWRRRLARAIRRSPARLALAIVLAVAIPAVTALAGYLAAKLPGIRRDEARTAAAALDAEIERGYLEVAEGGTDSAVGRFRRVLRSAAGDQAVEAAAGWALAHILEGRPEDALRALASDEHGLAGHRVLERIRAEALRRLGRSEEAEAIESRLGEPGDALEWFALGARDLTVRPMVPRARFKTALAHVTRAITLARSERALYHFERSRAATACGDARTAEECARVISGRWPESPVALVRAGMAWIASAFLGPGGATFGIAANRRDGGAEAPKVVAPTADQDRVGEAIACFQRALAKEPDMAIAWLQLGNARMVQGDLDAAASCYEKAVGLDPRNALARTSLGDTFAYRNDPDAAAREYRRAVLDDPGSTVARNKLAIILEHQGRLEEAEAEVRAAVALAPGWAAPLQTLASLARRKGARDEVLALCRRGVELEPDSPSARWLLGRALFELGRAPEALPELRTAVAGNPGLLPAWITLGEACVAAGDPAGAIAALDRALAMSGNDAAAWLALGTARRAAGEAREAVAAFRKAIDLQDTEAAWAGLIGAMRDAGASSRALAESETALDRHPDRPRLLILRGGLLLEAGESEAAAEAFRAAIPGEPAAAWIGLAAVAWSQERAAETVAAWRKALDADPRSEEAHRGLLRALEATGDGAAAAEELRRAARARPEDFPAAAAAVRALSAGGRNPDGAESADLALFCRRLADGSTDPALLRDAAAGFVASGDAGAARRTALRALGLLADAPDADAGLVAELVRLSGVSPTPR